MAGPTQLNPTEQDALVKQIGLALLRAAPADWTSVEVAFRAIGRYTEVRGQVSFADERTAEFPITPDVVGLFVRLRAGMYREGRGTWFNARYQLDRPAAYNLEYDRDEPRWQSPPPPPAFIDEVRMFPREEENVPEWLTRRLSALQPPFRTARIFDGMGPAGPVINRPPLEGEDREQVQRYLDAAPLALPARGYDTDHLDEERRQTVPVAYHTDGVWIWPAAVNFYLRTHGVPPDPELVAHARRVEFRMVDIDEQTRTAAAIFITGPPRQPVRPPERPAEPEPRAAEEPAAEEPPVEVPAIAEPQSTQAYDPREDDEDEPAEALPPVAEASPIAEEPAPAVAAPPVSPAAVVERLRERLTEVGVAESRYTVGSPSGPGWAMEQTGGGWRVGWFDGHYVAPAVFADADDAAAFLAGKLLLEPAAIPTDPGPSTVRASLAELEDDDDDTYDERPRRPLPPPTRPVQSGPSGEDLFRPIRPIDDSGRFATHQFDDEDDDYRPGRRRQPEAPLPESNLFSPAFAQENGGLFSPGGRQHAEDDRFEPEPGLFSTEDESSDVAPGNDGPAERFAPDDQPLAAEHEPEPEETPTDPNTAPDSFAEQPEERPNRRYAPDSPAENVAAEDESARPFDAEPGRRHAPNAFTPNADEGQNRRYAPAEPDAQTSESTVDTRFSAEPHNTAPPPEQHPRFAPEHLASPLTDQDHEFAPEGPNAPETPNTFAPADQNPRLGHGSPHEPVADQDTLPGTPEPLSEQDDRFAPDAPGAGRNGRFTPDGQSAPPLNPGQRFTPDAQNGHSPRFTPDSPRRAAYAEQDHPDQAPRDQTHQDQAHLDQTRPAQGYRDQAHPDQVHPERAHSDQAYRDQAHPDQTHRDQPHPEHAHPDQAHPDQTHRDQVHPEHAHSTPARRDQAYSNPAHPTPASSTPPLPSPAPRFAPGGPAPAEPFAAFAPAGEGEGGRFGAEDRGFAPAAEAGPFGQRAAEPGQFDTQDQPGRGFAPGSAEQAGGQRTDQLPEAQRRPEPTSGIRRPQDWPIQPLAGEPPLTLFRGKQLTQLPEGAEFDRYGDPTGNLTYAVGTPFDRRSLVPEWINRPYRAYRVLRPTEVLTGAAIPWFDQPGGGTAYVLPNSIAELIDSGAIEEIPDRRPPARA